MYLKYLYLIKKEGNIRGMAPKRGGNWVTSNLLWHQWLHVVPDVQSQEKPHIRSKMESWTALPEGHLAKDSVETRFFKS